MSKVSEFKHKLNVVITNLERWKGVANYSITPFERKYCTDGLCYITLQINYVLINLVIQDIQQLLHCTPGGRYNNNIISIC